MVTSVGRNVDRWSKDFLRSSSYAGGLDFRHQFLDRNFEVSGYYAQSLVQGSASAIARTQQSSVHNYQRPDDDLQFDSKLAARRWISGNVTAVASSSKRSTLSVLGFSSFHPASR